MPKTVKYTPAEICQFRLSQHVPKDKLCCECGCVLTESNASYYPGEVCDQCVDEKRMEETYDSMRGREV